MTPIMYTDPDGHIAFFVITMLIGAVVGAAAGVGIGYLAGYEGTDLIAWGVGGAVIGGVIGAVTGTLISYTATGSFTSSFSQIKAGFAAKQAAKSVVNGFDGFVDNPKSLWGKSADEVSNILGEGWTRGTYGSNGAGWKFTNGDKMIAYHAGGGRHVAEYYKISSGQIGKIKVVGPGYVASQGDKAIIIAMF